MKIVQIIALLLMPSLLHGMFTQIPRRTGIGTMPQRMGAVVGRLTPQAVRPAIQRRSLYTPEQLKGLYSKLTKEAQVASPVYGAAKYESGVLKKMWPIQSEVSAIKLVQELFYKQGQQFKPTALKSKAAYSLNPSILGLVIGALEANKLSDPETHKYIIEQWQAEHKNITNGDRMSVKKIENLLNLIYEAFKQDKNNTYSILLGFLYAKANPDNNHDMLHYLESFNRYIPVFEGGETIEKYSMTQPQSIEKKLSVMERFKKAALNIKKYVFKSENYVSTPKSSTFKPEDYASFQTALQSMHGGNAVEHAKNNFEESIGAILKNKQLSNIYPPAVVLARYGYEGKPERPNCVEAAMQDLFNIILYDSKSQLFDFSLLPNTIKPNPSFIQFYSLQNDISKINSPTIGQAFMDLISNIPGISYSMDNYELKAKNTIPNLITLANYLLGTSVTFLPELGPALSDEHRTITFTHIDEEGAIHVLIEDHKNKTQLNVDFHFRIGHGWLEVPERNKKIETFVLCPSTLREEYPVSTQAQALFSLHSDMRQLMYIQHPMPTSFYYTLDVNDDHSKGWLVNHILIFSTNNIEATDYAYHLFKELLPQAQIQALRYIMDHNVMKSNKKFEEIYKTIPVEFPADMAAIIKTIITYGKADQEAVSYAYQLYQSLTPAYQLHLLDQIIKSGISQTNQHFKNIYSILKPEGEWEKEGIIKIIVSDDSTNQEAVDYAYELYKNLPVMRQIILLSHILWAHIEKTNKNFEKIYKTLKPETDQQKVMIIQSLLKYANSDQDMIEYAYTLYKSLDENSQERVRKEINTHIVNIIKEIIYNKTDQESLNYAYSLFTKLDSSYKYHFFYTIMKSNVWRTQDQFFDVLSKNITHAIESAIYTDTLNSELIRTFHEKLPAAIKKRLLGLVLSALKNIFGSGITYMDIEITDQEMVDVVKELLFLGCDINDLSKNKHSENFTPLFFAIKIGSVPLLELLIEHGANIHEPITSEAFVNYNNTLSTLTPLHFAVEWGDQKMINTLVKHGADINSKNSSDSNNNITALTMACINHDENTVKILLELGADPNISGMIDGKITTPLLATVRNLNINRNNIIIELIKHNVDLNAIDSDGNTALDIALEQKRKHHWNTNNSYETVEILEKAGGHTNKVHVPESAKE